ncbi:hypothetical protein GCM10008015_26760 [Flavobacterium palustre]|uniref:Uncharacterized protein n=1 Tax=Flavobacterium palustre TaxID=1476463 RepID=A0ABQ1HQ97_9FLAO|nr:hypothetical protein [Flavobacterium palustre]GGA84631.1 hypothetical protein GCM10008015_26760 [Flavobacterium palustre]
MSLFKIVLGLILNKANKKQYYLEIGSHFLKKGCNVQVGQIVDSKRIDHERRRVKVITGIFYDFGLNKITHTTDKRILKK